MPAWNEVLKEIQLMPPQAGSLDVIRRKYLRKLSKETGRNVIAYYSGFLDRHPSTPGVDINDNDINAFMTVMHGLDRTKGLDLILHTPGGGLTATEGLVNYLRKMFGLNIRAIIPQICMSAGTMMACSCSSIVMGKQSSIGPIDPQMNGIPAQGVLDEFAHAIESVKKDPASFPLWKTVVEKYYPTFLGECQNAIDLSKGIVKNWLMTNMFAKDPNREDKARKVVDYLGDHNFMKTHGRHIGIDSAKTIGLNIEDLESDNGFQDAVLTVHHSYILTLNQLPVVKIVENQKGVAVVNSQQVANPRPL